MDGLENSSGGSWESDDVLVQRGDLCKKSCRCGGWVPQTDPPMTLRFSRGEWRRDILTDVAAGNSSLFSIADGERRLLV